MTHFDTDLFVIGAGSGGVRASRIAAGHGARVMVAEEYKVGGTCVIRGCVPKKLMVYASHFPDEFAAARAYGWSGVDPVFDWPTLRDNVQREVNRLNGLYLQTLARAGVTLVPARAEVEDAHTVRVDGRRITARHILVATGARPVYPDAPGAELGISSNEIFHLPALPKRVLVAGGGYIATEFAGILHGLGVEVTQLYRGQTILKGWDMDLRERLQAQMIAHGITVHTQAIFERIERVGGALHAQLSDGTTIETDLILHAIGRFPNTGGLGLERAGVTLGRNGAVVVDADNRTNIPSIHAVGDVTDRVQLTPVAIKEGHALADSLFGPTPWRVDYDCIASAVFAQPQLASVGLNEADARARYGAITVFRAEFRPMRDTLPGGTDKLFMKLVVDTATDRVVGVHMLGGEAAEIIQMAAIAVRMGATKADFDRTVAVHPTVAEEFVLMR